MSVATTYVSSSQKGRAGWQPLSGRWWMRNMISWAWWGHTDHRGLDIPGVAWLQQGTDPQADTDQAPAFSWDPWEVRWIHTRPFYVLPMWLGEARVIPELRTQRSHIVEEKILEEKTPECHQQFFSGWWLYEYEFWLCSSNISGFLHTKYINIY